MGCKSARLQRMPALFLDCCFRKWNLNGPQMQEPTRGDLFISPSLFFFFFFFFIATQQREQSCQNVCQENSVWEYREGSSAGSRMLFRVGQRRRAGSKTRLIAVLTEIHKRDRSYQAWPHCAASCEPAEGSLAKRPSSSLRITCLQIGAKFSVGTRGETEDLSVTRMSPSQQQSFRSDKERKKAQE